jgi:hypothetical protein
MGRIAALVNSWLNDVGRSGLDSTWHYFFMQLESDVSSHVFLKLQRIS